MDAGSNSEKSTTFRWLNVARYAVASVVTVLIATVVVIAIKTVVRPDSLNIKIVGGFISVERQLGSPPNQVQIVFTVRTDNPSGRAVMYYYNIVGYLFDKNISASTTNPDGDSFVSFDITNQTLQQQQEVDTIMDIPMGPDSMALSYFNMLYHNRSARIDDVTLRMDGYLVTEPVSGYNRTTRGTTTYNCSPLIIFWAPPTTKGGQDDDEANQNTQGSGLCTEVPASTVTSAR